MTPLGGVSIKESFTLPHRKLPMTFPMKFPKNIALPGFRNIDTLESIALGPYPGGGGHSHRKGMRVGLDGKTPFFEAGRVSKFCASEGRGFVVPS